MNFRFFPVAVCSLSLAAFAQVKAPSQAKASAESIKTASAASSSATPPDTPGPGDPRGYKGIPEQYVIGEGDVLQVSVWKEPDASIASMVVRADGKVTLPFIKEIAVSGMTAAEAEEMIATKLKPFITDPDVTIVVREVHSKKIYLVGAVRHTGAIELSHPMTVLQALTESGGPNEFAKKKEIYVLRSYKGAQYRLPFNYDAAIRGELPWQNYWLAPNDMVVVPQ